MINNVISCSATNEIDPVWGGLFKEVDSPYPIVIVTRLENYVFNEDLLGLDRYILVDGTEHGWNHNFETTGSHVWGRNTFDFDFGFKGEEWQKFDEFIKERPPILLFLRELMEGDQAHRIVPINYPCWYEIPELQTKEQFDSRPIQANFIWGLSHEYRKNLHAEIWNRAGEFGYVVCDNISNLIPFIEKEDNPKKWLTVNTPWYARHEMSVITKINELSKVAISLHGAGRHCFRMSEAGMAAIMFMWEDGIKYSYPWIDGINCIKSKKGEELQTIIQALKNPNLYDIYTNGVANCHKYSLRNYVRNYIEPIINKA